MEIDPTVLDPTRDQPSSLRPDSVNVLVVEGDKLYSSPLLTCLEEARETASVQLARDVNEARKALQEAAYQAIYVDIRKTAWPNPTDFIGFVRETYPRTVVVLYVRANYLKAQLKDGTYPVEWSDRLTHYFVLDKDTPLADFDLAVRDSLRAIAFDLIRSGFQGVDEESVQRVVASKYAVIKKLAEGGQAEVFLVRQMGTEQLCALKLMHERFSDNEAQWIQKEARLTASISHPNVVQVIDFSKDPATDRHFLATQFINGTTLQDELVKEDRISPERTISIVSQVAWGLTAAHSVGVLHRDLKPSNIMLRQLAGHRDNAVVMDFGLAKQVDSSLEGEVSEFGGTPDYMAPEQITGGQVGPFTDVYALAVCCYVILTGARPFAGNTPSERMSARLYTDPIPPVVQRPDLKKVEGPLNSCFERALHRNPETRTRLPVQFVEEIGQALGITQSIGP